MSYQVLARKWRPRSFPELVGQAHVVQALSNALDQNRLHHAFLFTGTRGVGKTTLARLLAKSLNCLEGVDSTPCGRCEACVAIDEGRFVDLIEVDAASRTRVDDTRELLDNVQYAPANGRYKVYLVDEVHMLSSHSFNALLKTLEEPPSHVKFLLATTDPQKLPVTVLSRCLRFNLKPLPMEMLTGHLGQVLAAEGVEAEPGAVSLVARAAEGSVRDALSLLDQAIAFGGGRLTEAEVATMLGSVGHQQVAALLETVATGDARAMLARVAELGEQGPDPGQLLAEVISLLHQVAVEQMAPGAGGADAEGEVVRRLAERLTPEDVQLFYQIALHGRRDLPQAPDPRAGLEMALLRMIAFQPEEEGAPAVAPPTNTGRVAEESPAPAPQSAAAPSPEPAPAPEAPLDTGALGATTGPDDAPPQPAQGDPADPAVWANWVEAIPAQSMVREMLRHTVWRGRNGNTIQLALDSQRDFLNSGRNMERLVLALQTFLQEGDLKVNMTTEEGLETPAQYQERRRQEAVAAAEAAIAADPVVNAVQDEFAGTIEPGSVEPLDGPETIENPQSGENP